MLELIDIFYAFQVAVFGHVFTQILMQQGMLFERYQDALVTIEDRLGKMVSYPLGMCTKCFTGQVALWWFIATQPFNLTKLILFISFSIISTVAINKLLKS